MKFVCLPLNHYKLISIFDKKIYHLNIEIKQNQALIKLTHNDGKLYWIQAKKLKELNSEDYAKLLEQFNKIAIEKDFEIQSSTTEVKKEINTFLDKSILKIEKQKCLFTKNLLNHNNLFQCGAASL